MGLLLTTPSFTLHMPAGSLQEVVSSFVVTGPASTSPWPITGATWEYCVRATPTGSGSPLIQITTTPTSQGVIAITQTALVSQALLSIYPAATASLTPGTYFQALWMNPGTTSAYSWWTGLLILDGNPQP